MCIKRQHVVEGDHWHCRIGNVQRMYDKYQCLKTNGATDVRAAYVKISNILNKQFFLHVFKSRQVHVFSWKKNNIDQWFDRCFWMGYSVRKRWRHQSSNTGTYHTTLVFISSAEKVVFVMLILVVRFVLVVRDWAFGVILRVGVLKKIDEDKTVFIWW